MNSLPPAIGRYEVKAFIARGGMGTLYLAQDPVLQRQVAIKLLRDANNDELRARFTREARSAANLRHRNIVTIFDVGEHEGQPFMAMEYIHGQTLHTLNQSDPPPSTIRRLQLLEELCDGLFYAHKRGVVHRDIKPANLMVDAEGTLKILDFGIARAAAESGMTQAGLLVGSLNYMSPEQVGGTPVDARSDMFAVGAVMYELLTGRQAFPGGIDGGVLNRILNVEPEPLESLCPHLDPAIGQIVRRALQKNPADRYADLQQMRTEIAQARRALEDSVLPDIDHTIAILPQQATTRATPAPSRRTDRDEIARRRTQQIEEHVAAAKQALADGKFDETIARCEQALLLDQNESRALDLAERARLQRDEVNAREWVTKARQHLKSGDFTTASSCVREALALTPDSPDALEMGRLVGEARLTQERERQRAAAVQEMLARGRAALDRGEPEGAIAAADEALALAPADETARRLREQAQQAIETRARQARDAEAQETVADARRLFAEGRHAEALDVLEQFWPAHTLVSQVWTELSAEAARIEAERAAPPTITTSPAAAAPQPPTIRTEAPAPIDQDERTVFVPRSFTPEPPAAPKPPVAEPPERTIVTAPERTIVPTPSSPPPAAPAPPQASATAAPQPSTGSQARPAPAAQPSDTGRTPPAKPAPSPAARPAAAARTQPAAAGRSKVPLYAGAVVVLAAAIALVLFFTGGTSQPDIGGEIAQGGVTTIPVDRGPGGNGTTPGSNGNTPPEVVTPVTVPPVTIPTPDPGASGQRGQGLPGPGVTTVPPTGGTGRRGSLPTTAPATTAPATTVAPTTVPPTTAPATTIPATTVPATTVAPTTVPPTTVPAAPPQVPDRQLIEQTLRAYAAAFEKLDVDAVVRLQPTADRKVLTDGFKELRSQTVDITPSQVTVNGNTATVTASVHTRAVPNGPRVRAPETTVATEFQLEKRGGTWVIVQRRAR